ncbi:MAG: DUF1194 domain-containing protein [Rhizobiales bacterium]|nr:DUF1194 domain-containing protein [Hyphomicrobiales bacterium]MBI3674140.1 DUF1194 domain-containing protein [Hyphomicrobiales bacterium]
MLTRRAVLKLTRRAAAVGLAGAYLTQARAALAEVDLALVLAIDCSFSVDAGEFRLQMQGLGEAFRRPEIKRAVRTGPRQRIAVAALQWSDLNSQRVVVPWAVLAGDADADELGGILSRTPRRLAEGGTSIASALLFSAGLFASGPSASRRVIDISSDGRNNVGPPVWQVRDRVVAQGISINGLVILNEWPTLDIYFENQVVGGDGHFVVSVNDYRDYGEAIYRKLLKEITGPGIA